MDILILLKAFLIGFVVAIPVGPVAILCVRRTLAHGPISGLASGLGASSADSFYAVLASLGLNFISYDFIAYNPWFRFIGGVILCIVGINTFYAPAAQTGYIRRGRGIVSDYITTFLLTITNPLTLVVLAALFAFFGLAIGSHDLNVWLIAVGVGLGSTLWWSIIITGASLFRKRLGANALIIVNKISGSIILFFGVVALATFLKI